MNLLPTGSGKTYLNFDIPESEGEIFDTDTDEEELEKTFESKLRSNIDF